MDYIKNIITKMFHVKHYKKTLKVIFIIIEVIKNICNF